MTNSAPVVVVTGVGPGTGSAIARRFSLGGYKVAMLARTRERLEVLERELSNAKGYPCDVIQESQLDSVLDAVRRELGIPRVLITTRWVVRSAISWKSIRRCSIAIFR